MTTSYGSFSAWESSFDYKTHVQTVSGLTQGTEYHFRPIVINNVGLQTTGSDVAFSTLSGGYPAETTLSYIAVPSLSLPAYLTPVTEPTFGTQLMRISDIATVANYYSKWQAWNSDQTRLLLVRRGSYPGVLLDASTYAVLNASQAYFGNPVWSNTDPTRIYGSGGDNTLRYTTVGAGTTTLKTFSGYTNAYLSDEPGISIDDRYFALLGVTTGGAQRVLVWDAVADSTIATISVATRPNNCMMTPSGTHVVVGFSSNGSGATQGTHLFTRTGTWVRQITTLVNHGDVGVDTDGNECWVTLESSRVRMYRLSDGTATNLTPTSTAVAQGHVSCRNYDDPGWATISPYAKVAGQVGDDWVFQVKLDGSNTVRAFAHMHNTSTTGNPYGAQPQATVSRDGKRVLWGANWDGTNSVYGFVAGVAL